MQVKLNSEYLTLKISERSDFYVTQMKILILPVETIQKPEQSSGSQKNAAAHPRRRKRPFCFGQFSQPRPPLSDRF
jgi:hypothetical protein